MSMNHPRLRPVILIIVLLTIAASTPLCSMKYKPAPGEAHVIFTERAEYQKPFAVDIAYMMGFNALQAYYTINLSRGISLVDGDLSWSGKSDSSYLVYKTIHLQINQPGYCQATFHFTATNISDALVAQRLPYDYTHYFYTVDGNITSSHDLAALKKHIADSLAIPLEDRLRRGQHRVDSLEALTIQDRTLFYFGFWRHHPIQLLDNTIRMSNISNYYNGELVQRIIDHSLIFNNLVSNVDSIVLADTTVESGYAICSPAIRVSIAQVGLSHIQSLRAIDQQIINAIDNRDKSNWPYLKPIELLYSQRRQFIDEANAQIDSIAGFTR